MNASAAPRTVLVVDDDVDFLEQQRLQLQAAGYRVITAESRGAAERLLRTETPDLAMIDIMMEESDGGFILCYHIRKARPNLPIIVVTNVTRETGLEFDAATEEERSWVKADVVLAKPVRFEQLRGEIERLLKE